MQTMKDYIPDSHENILNWLKNLKARIIEFAATLKWNAAKLALVNGLLDPLIAAYQTLVDAEKAASQASATADQTFTTSQAALRELVNELKANPDCTDGMEVALQIALTRTQRDPATIQPVINAETIPGGVRITGTKDYAELYNLRMRLQGTMGWTQIATNRKKFPFEDQTPAKTLGVPEVREYQARGVINDEEIGQPSAIVTATFAG